MIYTNHLPITEDTKKSMIDDMKDDPGINFITCGNVVGLREDDNTIIILTIVKEEIIKV